MARILTQRDRNAWARAFLAAVGRTPLTSDDYTFAVALRDKGMPASYAAARVQLRIRNKSAA